MKVGAFKLREPLPHLWQPDALVMLSLNQRWQHGQFHHGATGRSLRCQRVGETQSSRTLLLYNFARYRPEIYFDEDHRRIEIPNTAINYVIREQGNDLLLFSCLEPHMLGETYADSILKLKEMIEV